MGLQSRGLTSRAARRTGFFFTAVVPADDATLVQAP